MRIREASFSRRSSGVLLHVTSLPSGRLGTDAYEFVDWLEAAGQSWWQVLPLNPPDAFGSPYTSTSAFAAWRGLLAEPDAPVTREELRRFRRRHAYWIEDWESYAGPAATADQVRFEREWHALRRYAADRGVRLIGDIPIYVAESSADVHAHPKLFAEDLVAGAAPDVSHPEGQLWGQPVYDWRQMRREGYRWWIERFRRILELTDVARVDHFRGFVAYWAIPVGETDPRKGSWHRGPGKALFQAVEDDLGHLPLIAEDLGLITPAVDRLRGISGCSGCGSSSAGSCGVTAIGMRSRRIRRTPSSTPARTTTRRSPSGSRRRPTTTSHSCTPTSSGRGSGRAPTSSGRLCGSHSRRAPGSRSCRCKTCSSSGRRPG
jgi:4-alpha-glucanotransferase